MFIRTDVTIIVYTSNLNPLDKLSFIIIGLILDDATAYSRRTNILRDMSF